MRVIAGTRRSLPLKSVEGLETRPTTDRIKETLFNILMPDLPGAKFLDLFAGSGGIGIEALSRGADKAVFVDNSRDAVHCITENVKFTKFTEEAEIIRLDALSYVRSLRRVDFDIIFMDPPYGNELEKDILAFPFCHHGLRLRGKDDNRSQFSRATAGNTSQRGFRDETDQLFQYHPSPGRDLSHVFLRK